MRFALLLAAASLAAAQTGQMPRSTTEERTPRSPKHDVGTEVRDATVDYWDSISDYFRNSRRAIMAIRDKGIPDEEIPAVLHIARNSKASPNQIIDARKGGKSWVDIAKQHNAKLTSDNIPEEANLTFVTEYHGRTLQEVKALRAKGATWIDINQQFRRVGAPATGKKTTVR